MPRRAASRSRSASTTRATSSRSNARHQQIGEKFMTTTISALFDDYASASQAVRNLETAGLPSDDISIVANNADDWYDRDRPTVDRDRDGVDDRAEGAGAGAAIGGTIGGIAGLLAGLGLLAIPGIGPVV